MQNILIASIECIAKKDGWIYIDLCGYENKRDELKTHPVCLMFGLESVLESYLSSPAAVEVGIITCGVIACILIESVALVVYG